VAKLGGIKALTGKLIRRTNNKKNIAMATIEALRKLKIKNQNAKIHIKNQKGSENI